MLSGFPASMFPAILTTLLWALSTIFAQRSLRALGSTRVNIARLLFAFTALGAISLALGDLPLGGAGRDWLLLSGVIGMGLGDLVVFWALPQLGSRLTILICQCLAAPIAALMEWLWLDTRLTTPQLLWGLAILAGVAVALMPSRKDPPQVRVRWLGVLWGLCGAAGQGIGAVVSRKANLVAAAAGEHINGFTAAFQRIAGGLLITLAYFLILELVRRHALRGSLDGTPRFRLPTEALDTPPPSNLTWRNYRWVPLHAGCGAVLGVSAYQWALFTAPSAIVMPIVATTPLVIIPLTYWLEGERPSRRSLVGGLVAVAGAVGLALTR